MPFIGNQPALSYTSFAKQDFTTSATTSYTLDNPVSNANELALFINFVRQEPTTAYSASGTSLTLTSATSASDDMYCVYLGKAVQTVNPPSGSVGSSQVAASIITGQTALASEPDDTDEFLVSDAGTLKRIDYSLIKASPAMEKIATVTASGTSNVVSFDGHFSSTYDKYRIYIQNWRGNDNSHITMRYRIGNTEKSSGHYASVQEGLYRHSNGTVNNDNNSVWDGSAMRITPNGADNSATYFQHCVVDLINPLGTGYKTCTFETTLNAFDQTLFIHGIGGGHYFGDTGALSGLSFYISAGTITATIKIYGIKT